MLTRGGQSDGPLASSTIKRVHVIVHAALEQGVKWDMLPSNPDDRTTRPEVVDGDIEPPTPAEVNKLIAALIEENDPEMALFLRMSATVITRRGELSRLQWKSVDLETGEIRLPRRTNKTKRTRLITVGSGTLEWLRRHHTKMAERALFIGVRLTPESFVFSYEADCSRPMHPAAITRRFISLRNGLGLPHVRLHDLRHFAATQALGHGVYVVTVAERGGWANANVLLRTYAAFLPANDQAAAAVLDDVLDKPARRRVKQS
jgi:integrase